MVRPDSSPPARDPRLALRAFYALQFGHMGIVLPFLAPWFESRGFGAAAIGMLLALPPLFMVLAPWTWGTWADRTGRRHELLIVSCVLAGAALATLGMLQSAFGIVALTVAYAFLRAPILPYLEATSLEQTERRDLAYGRIRLWGSLAFIAVASGYGWLRGRPGADPGLLPAAVMLGGAAVVALVAIPRPLDGPSRAGSSIERPPGRRRGLARLLGACALMQASHGVYYTFYSIRLQNLGFESAAIGGLWALAVLCEVLLLTRMDRIVARIGTLPVLHGCLAFAALRWLVIGSSSDPVVLALAQPLHALTYAAFHVAAIREVFRRYGRGARARGQTMYSGMAYGLGLFAGTLAAGWLAASLGIPAAFLVSAAIALAALPVLGRA